MRFEYFGLTKMLVALATFTLALNFAGCSGESSTAADGNSDNQENSAIDDDSSGKDGSSSSSKKDDSRGKDGSSSSSKKDGSSGKDGSSSSSKKGGSSSSNKDRFANVKVPDIEIGKCDFKEDDEVWAYAYTETEDDDVYEAFSFTFFDGESTKDSVYFVFSGPETTQKCKQIQGRQKVEDELYGSKIASTRWCEDGVMYIIDVTTARGEYDVSRKKIFKTTMEECTSYNGVSANSSSSSAGRSSSSSEEEEESSSSSAATPQGGSTCDFDKDDDVWVMDLVGVGRTTLTWSGNSYTAVSEISVNLENETICEQSVENADPEDHAYCEGSVYKSRAERVVDDADRDEVYEASMAACAL